MDTFQTWFTHGDTYLFPDGTPVIALWTELGDRPRWWFVADHGSIPGLRGDLQLVVYPNGRIYSYVPEPNRENPDIFVPVLSDLCVDDLRPYTAIIHQSY
jgi:hypothetical protein